MCLYYKSGQGLTYENREHIFSNAVGGMNRLPRGYVSDQANALFSKIELVAFRQSFIALNRMVLGPGKKGSIINKSKSPVNIVHNDDGSFSLGILINMVDHVIPHCYMNDGKMRWGCNVVDSVEKIYQTMEDILSFNGKIKRLVGPAIPQGAILFGLYEKDFYIAMSDDAHSDEKVSSVIAEMIRHTYGNEGEFHTTHKSGKHSMMFQENNDISRVYGKTALNVLALIAGDDYAKRQEFDDFRNWITTGENMEKFHSLPDMNIGNLNSIFRAFPENSHWCILVNANHNLIVTVCYHSQLQKSFCLGSISDGRFTTPDGYICDWANKKEYRLLDWIVQMPIQMI